MKIQGETHSVILRSMTVCKWSTHMKKGERNIMTNPTFEEAVAIVKEANERLEETKDNSEL